MILITYCRSNAQGDLSHRYMRIRQCSFCVVVEVLSLNDLMYKYFCIQLLVIKNFLYNKTWIYM